MLWWRRPLLPDGADLLRAVHASEALDCAVAIVGPSASHSAAPADASCTRLGRTSELLFANAAAAAALSVRTDLEAHPHASLLLPDCAAAVELTASGACVVADAVRWQPSARSVEEPGNTSLAAGEGAARASSSMSSTSTRGSTGGIGGSGASRDAHSLAACSSAELVVDRLLICPITAPNGEPLGLARATAGRTRGHAAALCPRLYHHHSSRRRPIHAHALLTPTPLQSALSRLACGARAAF